MIEIGRVIQNEEEYCPRYLGDKYIKGVDLKMNFDNLSNPANSASMATATAPATSAVELDTQKPELPAVVAEHDSYQLQLREMPEVQALTEQIDVQDTGSVLRFGQKPSEGISILSDQILSSMKAVKAEEASAMMTQLTKLMDKFDIKEIESMGEKSMFDKIFNKIKKKVDDLFAKYEDLGKEVDKIAVILRGYEGDIQKANTDLDKLFNANIQYYQELEKYIVAGGIGLEEIANYKASVMADTSRPEAERNMIASKLDMMTEMLDQRVQDLRIAENVAMQTVPMIQTMQYSNFNLQRKINSSFIITLPIFKQCLIQAIQLKRAEIQAQSIKQLDDKTNELLIRNAQNTATQSVRVAEMAGTSSIKIETLKQTYDTIQKGIADTKAMQEKQALQRKADAEELEVMKADMKAKGFAY